MTVEIIPGEPYDGPERRVDALTREEHKRIESIAERKLNERFSKIYERFEDGTLRMQRIEESLNKVAGTVNENNRRHSDLAKGQFETGCYIERLEKQLSLADESTNERLTQIDEAMAANTAVTKEVKDILDAARGAFKFFNYLGSFLKWVLGLGGAALAFWVALKDFRSH